MAFLRSIGLALIAAVLTVLAFFGGFVFSVVSAVVSILLVIAGIFVAVYYVLWEASQDKKNRRS